MVSDILEHGGHRCGGRFSQAAVGQRAPWYHWSARCAT